MELLITKGAKVDQTDKEGMTPLLYAAENGHKEVAELLISKGAKVDQADKEGGTPLLTMPLKMVIKKLRNSL